MISSKSADPLEAYVWIWLPEQAEPVVAGRLAPSPHGLQFNYGQSYLARDDAISLYSPELPLQRGSLPLLPGLHMPGCLRDASPDAWGRRVIMNRLLGVSGQAADTAALTELCYLLASGSDRIGALDFQCSAAEYVPRLSTQATLEELMESAERVEMGLPLTPALAQALQHGTSIGGARPKAQITDGERKYIAKFSSSTDLYSVVKVEFVAMRLAALAGIDVAPVKLVQAAARDMLLVERFDRLYTPAGWQRKAMVSSLTLLGLDEMMARYASYAELAEIIRHRFAQPKQMLRELFARLTFNILCGNTDDHARNHSAFWDGQQLRLTPAYDICPQHRAGNEATQAMLISGDNRRSQLEVCVDAANQFLLADDEARNIIDAQIDSIRTHWDAVGDEAKLTTVDKALLWQRQFLNPHAFEGYSISDAG